jgi:hypothetical protein
MMSALMTGIAKTLEARGEIHRRCRGTRDRAPGDERGE